MANKATLESNQALASDMQFMTQPFINGQFTPASSGQFFESINPATGEVLTKVHSGDEEDINRAVLAARAAFEKGQWSKIEPSQRKDIMLNWADLIEKHQDELAVLESLDCGKPISDCYAVDISETLSTIRWYAEAADKLYEQLSPTQNHAMGLITKEPIGVVGAVLPWNFPMWMMAWKVGPALAAGNSIVVKPDEKTSLSALRIAALAKEAGVPDGIFNVVPGIGNVAGKALGMHPDVDVISFTGSTEVGRAFLSYSAESNLKNIVLECGGKSPSVVLSDAEDLDSIAEKVVNAAFWNMGQNCTANSRLIVHQSLKSQLLEKIVAKTHDWKIGDTLDPSTKVGAMISSEHFDKVMGYINQGKEEGANLIVGGKATRDKDGLFVEPTIFDNVTSKMSIAQDEIFGPVLAVITVSSDEEAIEVANDTKYGLQASIYSSNVKRALKAARAIRAGSVSVNTYSEGDISAPFGGFKLSGFGGRDKGYAAFDQYTETKTIWIDLD